MCRKVDWLRLLLVCLLPFGMPVSCATPLPRDWRADDGTVIHYRWHEPAALEAGKTYPLILFLHGAGERGDDNSAQLKHGVTPLLSGAERLRQPVFLVAPQCPRERYWSAIDESRLRLAAGADGDKLLANVMSLVDELSTRFPVDRKRIYVTGISMGGFATWDLIARRPTTFAAAVPICGGGDPGKAAVCKDVPIWAFHGDADPAVPVAATNLMIDALKAAGGQPKVTIYPGVGHESWIPAYDDPQLIAWLLANHRP